MCVPNSGNTSTLEWYLQKILINTAKSSGQKFGEFAGNGQRIFFMKIASFAEYIRGLNTMAAEHKAHA